MAEQIAMIPASGDEADEMKRKGWIVVGEKPVSKPKAKKETE